MWEWSEKLWHQMGKLALWGVAGGATGGTSAAGNSFLAARTPGGWQSTALVPPVDRQLGEGNWAYSLLDTTPDLSRFIFRASGRVEGAVVRLDRDQHQEALKAYGEKIQGVSPNEDDLTNDGKHLLLINTETAPRQLEDFGSGTPEVVSIMPDGTESECGLEGEGRSFIGRGASNTGAAAQWRPGYHMIATTDASRVYFQAQENGDCYGLLRLYERNREANGGAGETTLIDPGTGGHSPEFIRATPDGRSAYFTTYSNLDPADTNSHADVYRWDEETGKSTCVTCEANTDVEISPFAEGLLSVLVSDDFSHIYFVSPKQLVSGRGEVGARNYYALSGGTSASSASRASRSQNCPPTGTYWSSAPNRDRT